VRVCDGERVAVSIVVVDGVAAGVSVRVGVTVRDGVTVPVRVRKTVPERVSVGGADGAPAGDDEGDAAAEGLAVGDGEGGAGELEGEAIVAGQSGSAGVASSDAITKAPSSTS
jgi:hypothetical protein